METLRANHRQLKNTIHVRHIKGYLYRRGILTRRDLQRINSKPTEEERTEELLFILSEIGDGAYQAFLQSLNVRHGGCRLYDDVVELLEGTAVQGTQSADDDGRWPFGQESRKVIAKFLDPEKARKHLANSRFLTEEESKAIKDEATDEKANTLLCVLSTKGRNKFSVLSRVLHIQGLARIASDLSQSSATASHFKPVTNVQKPVNNFFKTNDAKKVKQVVLSNQITVLSALDGTGKTQISRWMATLILHLHPNAVVWRLDGRSGEKFLASKKDLLRALGTEVPEDSRVDECLDESLEWRGTPVLLIVEDLTDGSILTATFLKERSQSSVMLLIQQEDLHLPEEAPFPCVIPLEGFQTGEGIRFLQMDLPKPDIPIDHLQRLTDVFEGCPLMLAAARQHMKDTHTSPEHYLLLLKKKETARSLQQEAMRFMSQHYDKFDQRSLHPAFQAAHDELRASGDAPSTDEDDEETTNSQQPENTTVTGARNGTEEAATTLQLQDEVVTGHHPQEQGFADRVQDEEDGERYANEDEPVTELMSYPNASARLPSLHSRLMAEEVHKINSPTVGSHTQQAEEASSALQFEEEAVASHPPDDLDTESSSGDSGSLVASTRRTEEGLELEGAVGCIFSPLRSSIASEEEEGEEEEQKIGEEGEKEMSTVGSQTQQAEEAFSALQFQEEAVASHPPDDLDTESSPDDLDTESSSGDSGSLVASTRSTEEGLELEGAVGGISSPPRSHAASQTGLPRAVASVPSPGAHYARLAVPCHQVQPATRILCQLMHLPEPNLQQQVEDLSPSGPPALIVLENQEFPMVPAGGQLVQQTSGTVLVYSHASEQLIATEQGHPQQFLWEVAARIDLTREVFDHVLDSSFTFRYYVPRRPPDTLPFVPRDATIGTGTTVQAVAATEGLCWAWRITSTQTGPELEFYMDLESSQGGAYGYQRMAGRAHVVPAGLNPEHRSWRNSHMQQSSSPTPVSLEAERDRLQTRVGQASIPVSVQRGNEAQIVQEIIHLYLQTPSAAACRLNVQYVGESAIDCGGPGRELFMLVWRWLSERCLENGIPRQSPDLEPGTFQFWLAIGRFIFHMFVLYNCFPVHLARFVVEAMFNGAQQLGRSKVAWLTTFLDTLPVNIRTLLFESCSNETAFEQKRDQLTEALMTWGMSTFPQSPADLSRMLPRIGQSVCLDLPYVALAGLINGFREGWQACVMPGDVDRLILQHSCPTSYLGITPALDIDASNVDSDTGRRMRGHLNRWLQNADPAMLQQFLITVTGCSQLTGNQNITIIFDPDYPANAICTCTQTLPVPVVETYNDFCTYMTGVLSGNTFNTV